MTTTSDKRSTNFLIDASLLYKDTCPELSRFLLCHLFEHSSSQPSPASTPGFHLLSYCISSFGHSQLEPADRPVNANAKGSPKQKCSHLLQNILWLQPDNHRVRLRPKRRPSARVQSILRRKAQGKRLTLVQKNLLHRFQKSSSVLKAEGQQVKYVSRHTPVLGGRVIARRYP
ncbi:hypothetical protein INR49_023562 [Caranx melampygus]|nr:hypothetical protein INR49_023562 [Caranx melampygus]